MNKSWYKRHCIGAIISFITSVLGVIVPLVFDVRPVNSYKINGFFAISHFIDHYAGNLVNILAVFGILFSFYFCIRIIIQAIRDNINSSIYEEYKYLLGLFSSFALIFLKLYSAYNLPIIYNLIDKFDYYIATVVNIPSYIGILTSIYFFTVLIFKQLKDTNS